MVPSWLLRSLESVLWWPLASSASSVTQDSEGTRATVSGWTWQVSQILGPISYIVKHPVGDYDSPTLLAATPRPYEPDPFTLGAPNAEPFDWSHSGPNSATDLMAAGGEAGAAAGAVGAAGAGLGAASRYSYTSRQGHGPSRESTYSAGPAASLAPTARSGKTNATGATRSTQPRFIMHTDAADEVTEEPDEVIELPPQYTERRRLPEYGGEGSSTGSAPLGDVKRR